MRQKQAPRTRRSPIPGPRWRRRRNTAAVRQNSAQGNCSAREAVGQAACGAPAERCFPAQGLDVLDAFEGASSRGSSCAPHRFLHCRPPYSWGSSRPARACRYEFSEYGRRLTRKERAELEEVSAAPAAPRALGAKAGPLWLGIAPTGHAATPAVVGHVSCDALAARPPPSRFPAVTARLWDPLP